MNNLLLAISYEACFQYFRQTARARNLHAPDTKPMRAAFLAGAVFRTRGHFEGLN